MSEKTITKIPNVNSIVVARGGKQVSPVKGKPFAFTATEIEDIERLSPGAIRDAVNEGVAEDDDGADAGGDDTQAPAEEKAKAPKGKRAADDLGGL